MPLEIKGQKYYRTAEVCQIAGIGRSTLFRWIKNNIVEDVRYRDRNGWRLFTDEELDRLMSEASTIQRNHVLEMSMRL